MTGWETCGAIGAASEGAASRRDFLRVAAVAGTAWASGSRLSLGQQEGAGVTEKPIPIVDTHQHLWDLTKFRLPWSKGHPVLGKSFVTKDYLDATRGLPVVKSVYMEVDVDPAQQVQEAEYVSEICRAGNSPMAAAVISGRPASPEFKAYITKFKDNKYIKGVRQVLHVDDTPAGYCLQPKFVEGVQLLGELGMSFDLCMRAGELLDGAKLVDLCPRTRFIVDHCGNLSVQNTDKALRAKWEQGLKELAARKNVVCKISGIIASAKPDWQPADLAPNMNFAMETFGEDRIMFAGDWPVCTLTASFKQWVEALQTITRERGRPFQQKLFHDNAVKFYGLS